MSTVKAKILSSTFALATLFAFNQNNLNAEYVNGCWKECISPGCYHDGYGYGNYPSVPYGYGDYEFRGALRHGYDLYSPDGNPYYRNPNYYPGYYTEYHGYFFYPAHYFCNHYYYPVPYYKYYESKYGIFDENSELYIRVKGRRVRT